MKDSLHMENDAFISLQKICSHYSQITHSAVTLLVFTNAYLSR